jgi:hypothetical protein
LVASNIIHHERIAYLAAINYIPAKWEILLNENIRDKENTEKE